MKKQAREAIAKRLEDNLRVINREITRNAYEMNKLAKQNELLKRQRPELQALIKQLTE
jgi:hypothetical protein